MDTVGVMTFTYCHSNQYCPCLFVSVEKLFSQIAADFVRAVKEETLIKLSKTLLLYPHI